MTLREKFNLFNELKPEIQTVIEDVAKRVANIDNVRYNPDYDIEWYVEDDIVYCNWEEWWGGENNYYSVKFPTEYLFDDNWEEALIEHIKEIKRKMELAKQKEDEELEKSRQENRYKLYLKLKQEFEDDAFVAG